MKAVVKRFGLEFGAEMDVRHWNIICLDVRVSGGTVVTLGLLCFYVWVGITDAD